MTMPGLNLPVYVIICMRGNMALPRCDTMAGPRNRGNRGPDCMKEDDLLLFSKELKAVDNQERLKICA